MFQKLGWLDLMASIAGWYLSDNTFEDLLLTVKTSQKFSIFLNKNFTSKVNVGHLEVKIYNVYNNKNKK